MIRLTPIPPHQTVARADAVKRLHTSAELQAHAIAIEVILKRLGAKT